MIGGYGLTFRQKVKLWRDTESAKLRTMTFGGKIGYIFTYYWKWMLLFLVAVMFCGYVGDAVVQAHRETVLAFMGENAAIRAKSGGRIVGILLFARAEQMLCFLAVDPACRRRHIAEQMVTYMLTFLDSQKEVVVTTYREEAPEGAAARAFYKRMGFAEGRLTEEFVSPVQEFVLKR